MADIMMCTGQGLQAYRIWPQKIYFSKVKDNLKFLYFIPLQMFWYPLKDNMQAEILGITTAIHKSLALINCKQGSN